MANRNMTYEQALHAMQSGVKAKMSLDDHEVDPKHLRVGNNSAHVTDKALAQLLIDKGLMTLEEYKEAVRKAMIDEVDMYERELTRFYGKPITLL